MQVLLAGATGTIGRAVAARLRGLGCEVFAPVRRADVILPRHVTPLVCDLGQAGALTHALEGRSIDAVISCLATRTGAPRDAWAVEHDAQVTLLHEAGAARFVLLSAICVQKPMLAFQHAKLAFEARLIESGLPYSIVRPTAFFKSLSGQVARLQAGKPFLVFGNGRATACKPISDRDLARFLVDCLTDEAKANRILPIGGPGPAITPLDQAHHLFDLMGQAPRVRHVPFAMMYGIVGALTAGGWFNPRLRDKAEFARTGRYYARESMLLWDAARGCYDAQATPEFGSDTLWDHYADLLAGRVSADLGAHAVF